MVRFLMMMFLRKKRRIEIMLKMMRLMKEANMSQMKNKKRLRERMLREALGKL